MTTMALTVAVPADEWTFVHDLNKRSLALVACYATQPDGSYEQVQLDVRIVDRDRRQVEVRTDVAGEYHVVIESVGPLAPAR